MSFEIKPTAPTIGGTLISSGSSNSSFTSLSLGSTTLTGTTTAQGDINMTVAGGPGSIKDELTLILMGAL